MDRKEDIKNIIETVEEPGLLEYIYNLLADIIPFISRKADNQSDPQQFFADPE